MTMFAIFQPGPQAAKGNVWERPGRTMRWDSAEGKIGYPSYRQATSVAFEIGGDGRDLFSPKEWLH